MKYILADNLDDTLNIKFYSATQYRLHTGLKILLQFIFRRVIRFSNKYLLDEERMVEDYSYNYFKNKMWKESGSSANKLSSTVSPRTWHRHSALLSLWQEQRK